MFTKCLRTCAVDASSLKHAPLTFPAHCLGYPRCSSTTRSRTPRAQSPILLQEPNAADASASGNYQKTGHKKGHTAGLRDLVADVPLDEQNQIAQGLAEAARIMSDRMQCDLAHKMAWKCRVKLSFSSIYSRTTDSWVYQVGVRWTSAGPASRCVSFPVK